MKNENQPGMNYAEALEQALEVKAQLDPHCYKCEIAGSIRRKKATGIKDIEMVIWPKPYQTGLFSSGIVPIVDQWTIVKGHLPCKYTKRILPGGTQLDLFLTDSQNFGLIYFMRTGPAEYSKQIIGFKAPAMGYQSVKGYLRFKGGQKSIVPIANEQELFKRLKMKFVQPWDRK